MMKNSKLVPWLIRPIGHSEMLDVLTIFAIAVIFFLLMAVFS